jgi:hypothetical protein
MKLSALLIVPVLLAGTAFAAVAEDYTADAEQPDVQQQQPADKRTPQRPAPASSFTPSETVGADSAVSFPVDI